MAESEPGRGEAYPSARDRPSALDEHGDVEDIVSFASPSFLRDLGQ